MSQTNVMNFPVGQGRWVYLQATEPLDVEMLHNIIDVLNAVVGVMQDESPQEGGEIDGD